MSIVYRYRLKLYQTPYISYTIEFKQAYLKKLIWFSFACVCKVYNLNLKYKLFY